jgi:hypothetical protein
MESERCINIQTIGSADVQRPHNSGKWLHSENEHTCIKWEGTISVKYGMNYGSRNENSSLY